MANAAAKKMNISNARFGGNALTFYFVFTAPTNSAHIERGVLYATGNATAEIAESVLTVAGDCSAAIKENVIFVN